MPKRSEAKFEGYLRDARIAGTGYSAEGRSRTYRCPRIAEIGRVEYIEGLQPQVKSEPVSNIEGLHQSRVEADAARPSKQVARRSPKGS